MPGEGRSWLAKAADVATVVGTPVGILLAGISVWLVLEGRPETRGVLSPYWGWVRRWWLSAVVLLAVGVALVLVLRVPRVRRGVLWPFKWLGGTAKRLYLWLLSDVLARPLRKELALAMRAQFDEATSGRGAQEEDPYGDLLDRVHLLSDEALAVLLEISKRHDPIRGPQVLLKPSFAACAESGKTMTQWRADTVMACQELARQGIIGSHMAQSDSLAVVATLDERVRRGLVLGMRTAVREEMVGRGLMAPWDR